MIHHGLIFDVKKVAANFHENFKLIAFVRNIRYDYIEFMIKLH